MENALGDVERSPCFDRPAEHTATERDPRHSAFAALVFDVAAEMAKRPRSLGDQRRPIAGRFIQGRYDPTLSQSVDFTAEGADKRVVKLGRDFMPDAPESADEPTYLRGRRRLFSPVEQGGFGLDDVMAFPLLRPDPANTTGDLDIVGVVTLHDWSYRGIEADENSDSPWEPGWANAVAHVQTYVPYLLTQAEVLENPLNDARRFLIHAGRAELIAVLDTMRRMRDRVESSLAPDRGVRQIIDRLLAPSFSGDSRAELQRAQLIAEKAWEAVQSATSPVSEQSLSQLSNVMQSYRELRTDLNAQIAAANEDAHLHQEIKKLIDGYKATLTTRGVYCDIVIPEQLTLRLPLLWLRILLADLVHNAAKYATSSRAFSVTWRDKQRSLIFSNAGSYRSDLDTEERMVLKGTQGSAALVDAKGGNVPKVAGIIRQGQGMGVWGVQLLCRILNIHFKPEIKPAKNVRKLADGTLVGEATYVFTLTFPEALLAGKIPATDDYF